MGKKTNKKKKNGNKIWIVLVVIAIIAVGAFLAFKGTSSGSGDSAKLRFSEMYTVAGEDKNISEIFKELDGKEINMTGYMAAQSPLDGSFIYLVNQPYVSCPFCAIGDITKLEVIPVYMEDGSEIQYLESGVKIVGRLEVSEKVDSLGYTTQCRIYAKNIEVLTEENTDVNLQSWYATLTESQMIIDMQTLQMNIEYATKEEYLLEFGETVPARLDGMTAYYLDGIDEYISYINECPPIVEAIKNDVIDPSRTDLITLSDELYTMFEKEITIFERLAGLLYKSKEVTTDEEKIAIYNEILSLNAGNLELYTQYNSWNNRLREI